MITWSLWILLGFLVVTIFRVAIIVTKAGDYNSINPTAIFYMIILFPSPFILLDYLI